jgi:hypothetical protein
LDVAAIVDHKHPLVTGRYYHPDKAYVFEVAKKVQNRLGEMHQSAETIKLENVAKSM